MVDLVKIRKKSKDSKEAAAASPTETRPEVEPSPSSAAPAPRSPDELAPEPKAPLPPEPVAAKKKSEPASAPPAAKKPAAPAPVLPDTPAKEAPAPAAPPPAVEPVEELDEKTEDRLARFKRLAGKRRTWTAAPKVDEPGRAEEEERGKKALLQQNMGKISRLMEDAIIYDGLGDYAKACSLWKELLALQPDAKTREKAEKNLARCGGGAAGR